MTTAPHIRTIQVAYYIGGGGRQICQRLHGDRTRPKPYTACTYTDLKPQFERFEHERKDEIEATRGFDAAI
jgi:hypothetical protein